jgi:hypothetical protein
MRSRNTSKRRQRQRRNKRGIRLRKEQAAVLSIIEAALCVEWHTAKFQGTYPGPCERVNNEHFGFQAMDALRKLRDAVAVAELRLGTRLKSLPQGLN